MTSQAIHDVLAERQRQIYGEGFGALRDDNYRGAELARAGAAYAIASGETGKHRNLTNAQLATIWPWSVEWWKPSTPRRDLVKAAALIIAEIERLDRAEARTKGGAA